MRRLFTRNPSATSITMKASDFELGDEVETWSDDEHKWVRVRVNKPQEDPIGEAPDDISDTEFPDLDSEIDWHAKKPSLELNDDDIVIPETPMTPTQKVRKIHLRGTPIQKRQARRRTQRLVNRRLINDALDKIEAKVDKLKKFNARLVLDNHDLRVELVKTRRELDRLRDYTNELKINYSQTLSRNNELRRKMVLAGKGLCAVKTHPDVWKFGQKGRDF